MNILKIDSSPRQEESNSRRLTQYLCSQLTALHTGAALVQRDVANTDFPPISPGDLIALHASRHEGSTQLPEHYRIADELVAELKQADALVMGIAVHNFSVPAQLKRWIDYICRVGHTFKYGENGPVGLTHIENAYLVVSAGGMPIGSDWDFASTYVSHICQFIGVKNVHIIDASGSKRTPELVIEQGKAQIDQLLSTKITP